MRTDDPIQGVSVRNTKRHIRKKWKLTAVGENGPQLPGDPMDQFPITRIDLEDHVHPRSKRTPQCDCGYPSVRCPFWDDDCIRNYCFKEHN